MLGAYPKIWEVNNPPSHTTLKERRENMGDNADDIIEGLTCELGCGTYFRESHGYPVVCNECWKNMTKAERRGRQKATIDSDY